MTLQQEIVEFRNRQFETSWVSVAEVTCPRIDTNTFLADSSVSARQSSSLHSSNVLLPNKILRCSASIVETFFFQLHVRSVSKNKIKRSRSSWWLILFSSVRKLKGVEFFEYKIEFNLQL